MHLRVLSAICVLLATVTVAQSRRWFAHEVNCWITQKKVPASWEDAQQRCKSHGAILASPLNTQLFDYIQSLISVHNHSAAYFIGTRANSSRVGQVNYVSVEGKRLDDIPRAVYDAIERLDIERGDCLSMDRHGIHSVSCKNHLPYICYSNETKECGSVPSDVPALLPITNTSGSSPSFMIPPGYTYKPATRSYYKLHKSLASWYEASATCASEGAYLVVLGNKEERRIVESFLTESGNHNDIWRGSEESRIGGLRVWRVANGQPVSEVHKVWYESLRGSGPSCAALTHYFALAYMPCDNAKYFTCEISQ